MNRYGLIIVMLLGACVCALIILFGDAHASDARAWGGATAAGYRSSTWYAPEGGYGSSSASDASVLPLQGGSRVSLFRHAPAAPVYSTSAAEAAPAAGAQGLYLVSQGSVQSYGGGVAAATSAVNYTAAGSSAATGGYVAGGYSTAASGSASATTEAIVLSSSPASALAVAAEAYPMAHYSAPARRGKGNKNTIEDTYYQWLQSGYWQFGGGGENLSESQIRALWDELCSQNEDFALTYTFDEFFAWIQSKQNDENFKWKLPIGDGVIFLLLLCMSYALVRYGKENYKKYDEKYTS